MHGNSRFILDLRIFKNCCPNIFPSVIVLKLICKLCDPYCFFPIFKQSREDKNGVGRREK